MNNYIDEGYIKFDIDWEMAEAPHHALLPELMHWRNEMYALGLIGFYEDFKVGYGNISVKTEDGFIVSGTQTGHIADLEATHYTLVDSYNIEKNALHCVGPVKASSESLTHAAIYECNETIKAVVHVHHKTFWKKALYNVPTSPKDIPYGTPEMAKEIFRLYKETSFSENKIMAMEGHDEGIITFGETLEEAAEVVKLYFDQFVS